MFANAAHLSQQVYTQLPNDYISVLARSNPNITRTSLVTIEDCGGGGDCLFLSIGKAIGRDGAELRAFVSEHLTAEDLFAFERDELVSHGSFQKHSQTFATLHNLDEILKKRASEIAESSDKPMGMIQHEEAAELTNGQNVLLFLYLTQPGFSIPGCKSPEEAFNMSTHFLLPTMRIPSGSDFTQVSLLSILKEQGLSHLSHEGTRDIDLANGTLLFRRSIEDVDRIVSQVLEKTKERMFKMGGTQGDHICLACLARVLRIGFLILTNRGEMYNIGQDQYSSFVVLYYLVGNHYQLIKVGDVATFSTRCIPVQIHALHYIYRGHALKGDQFYNKFRGTLYKRGPICMKLISCLKNEVQNFVENEEEQTSLSSVITMLERETPISACALLVEPPLRNVVERFIEDDSESSLKRGLQAFLRQN